MVENLIISGGAERGGVNSSRELKDSLELVLLELSSVLLQQSHAERSTRLSYHRSSFLRIT